MRPRPLLLCFLLLLSATNVLAALSKQYKEWGRGPVTWIMTSDEHRAWRAVKTDEEATRFFDLFWARRDPTPNTPENEFRNEFEKRVNYADLNLQHENKRGSMTERGHVYVVLGMPTETEMDLGLKTIARTNRKAAIGSVAGRGEKRLLDPAVSRPLKSRHSWIWKDKDAEKYDLKHIEVVFIEMENGPRRDPEIVDWTVAESNAIRNAITNPKLTEVPAWAAKGGLEEKPKEVRTASRGSNAPISSGSSPSAPGAVRPAAPVLQALDPAAIRPSIFLLRDADRVSGETPKDPFTTIETLSVFKPADDLGWMVRYCSGSLETPVLNVGVHLSGKTETEKLESGAPPEEMRAERIKATPGCHFVRGVIPLSYLEAGPGDYELKVTVETMDAKARHELKQAFRVE